MGEGEEEDLTVHAMGIALTATFGTISIRHPDGTFEDLGRVDGDGRYEDMMRRLSSQEEMRLAPPYSSSQEMLSELLRTSSRAIRRSLGPHASSDVKILSEMLELLIGLYPPAREGKQKQMGTRSLVVILHPALPALYGEDILDAASYLGIRVQNGQSLVQVQPSTLVAAYAGYGRDLCNRHATKEKGRNETRKPPEVDILHVEVTSNTIIVSVNALKATKSDTTQDARSRAFWNLGQRFETHLTSFLRLEYPAVFPKDMVVLFTGEGGLLRDGQVQGIVAWVLHRNGVDTVKTLSENPEFVAARAAAELFMS
ncbi:uncharacterized protein BDV14DRAFT_196457 [Aspergillus stella-maris]|uniref:uncharacterized protein n=1 Tax=Aspergillus stella-maris TaxID=1810926 RepID=UPI003CCE0AC6